MSRTLLKQASIREEICVVTMCVNISGFGVQCVEVILVILGDAASGARRSRAFFQSSFWTRENSTHQSCSRSLIRIFEYTDVCPGLVNAKT